MTLMVCSGFAGLGYQIIWTQQCALWLGHESAAVLAVVTAFLGGLAVGGLALGSRIERSAHAVYWYAGCEILVALWSALLLVIGAPFSVWMQRMTGAQPSLSWQWSLALAGTFCLLLPATAAMGATLPTMERLTAHVHREGRSISALYASNTFGAVLGVLVVALVMIPAVGLARSAALCIALNVACALIALAVFPRALAAVARQTTPDRSRARASLARLATTGLLGIGYEVLVVRVVSQLTEDTVYTFAILLAVYLVGSAAGAAAYQRWGQGYPDQEGLSDRLLAALATACLVGTASLWEGERLKTWVLGAVGTSLVGALAAEAALAIMAFAAPTILMGAVFSHLSQRASRAGATFGRALGVNLLAAAVAPVLFGVCAVPALGPKVTLLLIVAGYLASIAPRAWVKTMVLAPAGGALAIAFFAPPLAFIEIPEGGHVVSYREGMMAAVSVVEDAAGVARLRINNRQQEGTSATRRVDARQAWLPLVLHPAPRRALFLGLGTGVTSSSAAEDPTLDVEAVELLPEVIAASVHFGSDSEPGTAARRLRVVAADARRYVRATDQRYDVIVSDNFHPARSGSGVLYTVEHFEAVRRRLDAGGVFCQWLPLHQLDLDTLRSIVQSFVRVYPESWAMIASNSLETPVIGLVARADHGRFDAGVISERLSRLTLRRQLAGLGLEDALAVLGSFVAGPPALRAFAGNAAANTDDLPIVAYRAPRITYAPDSRPGDRLIALLRAVTIGPSQLILPDSDSNLPHLLASYWEARDLFIVSGRDMRPSSRVEDMLAQARGPLLAVLRISPQFRFAYDPLLAMAGALARSDVPAARALLAEMVSIQPARTEAAKLLEAIDAQGAGAGRQLR